MRTSRMPQLSRSESPRQYPQGFGQSVRKAYEKHLTNTAHNRRDLRFKPQSASTTSVEWFKNLPMDDPWEEADLLPCLVYLMESKHMRWGSSLMLNHVEGCESLCCRIPADWLVVMKDFRSAYESQAPVSNHIVGNPGRARAMIKVITVYWPGAWQHEAALRAPKASAG